MTFRIVLLAIVAACANGSCDPSSAPQSATPAAPTLADAQARIPANDLLMPTCRPVREPVSDSMPSHSVTSTLDGTADLFITSA